MVNANSDVAVKIDGAGGCPAPTASVGKMPVSAGAPARSKRAKQEVGKIAELAGLVRAGTISLLPMVPPNRDHGLAIPNQTKPIWC
jgi:hypothetical protein